MQAARDYKHAGSMLEEDEVVLIMRASLCPVSIFTQNYRDRYAQFVGIVPCP